MRGAGIFDPVHFAQNIFGLGGEAMLNFGPVGVPAVYLLFGLAVGRLTRFVRSLAREDPRRLLVPFLVNVAFWALVSDSDNVLWVLVKTGTVPSLLVLLGVQRSLTSPRPTGELYRVSAMR